METAYKEKDNKLNYELDFGFIEQLAERMSANKGKYAPYNWQKLDNIEDLKQALFRHVIAVMKGDFKDDGRTFGHLEGIALNCMFINFQLRKKEMFENLEKIAKNKLENHVLLEPLSFP